MKSAAFKKRFKPPTIKPDLIEEFKKTKLKNQDSYGARIMSYAEDWAFLMEEAMAAGKRLEDVADATSSEADYDGITGFMHGAGVATLNKFWVHGEKLKDWHNAQYGVKSNNVVNPAVINIKNIND